MKKAFMFVAAMAATVLAQAAPCAVQVHVAAVHANDTGYNNDTYGVGVLCPVRGDYSFAAGTYRNSVYRQSVYAVAVWQPLEYGRFKFGGIAGVVSGYNKSVVPLAAGLLSVALTDKVSMHVLGIPAVRGITPAVAELSFSFKF